jgi:hypothetical protein
MLTFQINASHIRCTAEGVRRGQDMMDPLGHSTLFIPGHRSIFRYISPRLTNNNNNNNRHHTMSNTMTILFLEQIQKALCRRSVWKFKLTSILNFHVAQAYHAMTVWHDTYLYCVCSSHMVCNDEGFQPCTWFYEILTRDARGGPTLCFLLVQSWWNLPDGLLRG